MSDNQFKPGDVVQLKSGSVLITVVKCIKEGKLECQWQNQSTGEFQTRSFHPVVLQKV